MGHYANETEVMLLGAAAERGDTEVVLRNAEAQAFFWEIEWLRGLAYAAGVPVERLGISEEHAWRLAKDALKGEA